MDVIQKLSSDLNSCVSNIVKSMKGLLLPGTLWSFFHWSCVKINQTDKAVTDLLWDRAVY